MKFSRMYKSFFVGAGFTLLSAFAGSTNIFSPRVKMPYKKYGYTERQAAARLLDRFTFGAKPGQIEEVVNMGIDHWFEQQLDGQITDTGVDNRLSNYKTLSLNNETIVNTYMNGGQIVRFAIKNGLIEKDSSLKADKSEYRNKIRMVMEQQGFRPIAELQNELINQKIIRASYSNNQLHELLTDFWFNHFNVSLTKNQCTQYIMTYERDAIRPNVVGNFETMLLATAKHPAMLEFLDNASSVSNNNNIGNKKVNTFVVQQAVNARKTQGLNENYAREIMELHTMGVDAGYTQSDVTAVARALTGWGFRPLVKDAPGNNLIEKVGKDNLEKRGYIFENDFMFRADKHDDSAKIILGKSFPANGGYKEGEEVINMLATNDATANFICKKLATRFVSDTPSVDLVRTMSAVFKKTNGNIKVVLKVMVNDAAFWNQKIIREKVKSPFELVISAVRATNADVQQPFQLYNWCTKMGQKLYYYQAPTGFPDKAAYWINTGALLNRMNFGLAFAGQKIPGLKMDLLALNNNHEPESADQALALYSNLLLPERDNAANIKRLSTFVRDGNVADKINQAAEKTNTSSSTEMMNTDMMNTKGKKSKPYTMHSATVNNSMVAQVTGIIIGSPEFQRK